MVHLVNEELVGFGVWHSDTQAFVLNFLFSLLKDFLRWLREAFWVGTWECGRTSVHALRDDVQV